MKSYMILFFALVAYVSAEDQYDTSDFNLEELLENERLLKGYSKCLLDKGPCTPEVKKFKDKIPEVLETNCAKCKDSQKKMGKQLAREMRTKYPEMWQELLTKYDPEGKYQESFHEYLNEA